MFGPYIFNSYLLQFMHDKISYIETLVEIIVWEVKLKILYKKTKQKWNLKKKKKKK